jgi:hypothetical protein
MAKFHKLFISKLFALLLTILLFHGPYTYRNYGGTDNTFTTALEEYRAGSYKTAAAKLEFILSFKEEGTPESKAKVYLLLGACCEKSGEKEKAKNCFVDLKKILDEGLIDRVPAIAGVDTTSLSKYREAFAEESFFSHKKPTAVSEMMRKNVVQAPRKTIEEKEKIRRNAPYGRVHP